MAGRNAPENPQNNPGNIVVFPGYSFAPEKKNEVHHPAAWIRVAIGLNREMPGSKYIETALIYALDLIKAGER